MSLKRRNTSSPEPDDSPVSKRQRPSPEEDSDESFDHPFGSEQPRSDPIYGQKGAFPGLDGNDDELFYGPPSDGLEYLRMVRSEAKGVPHLLVAPQAPTQDHSSSGNSLHNSGSDDQAGGYYADGAYTAALRADVPSTSDHRPPDAQELFYESLSVRFKLLRATVNCSPPLLAVERLPSSSLISLPPDTETAQSQWRHHLQSSDPLMVQLACMDSESVLEVVKILTGMMAQTVRSKSRDRVMRFGAWVWGVLGKCKDRTELGSEEIAVLRELGKRAVKLVVGTRDKAGKANDGSEEVGEDMQDSIRLDESTAKSATEDAGGAEDTMHNGHPGLDGSANPGQGAAELQAAKERLKGTFLSTVDTGSLSPAAVTGETNDTSRIDAAKNRLGVDQQIRIALDMIVTIVGDFYGQRDLLEFRDIWDEV